MRNAWSWRSATPTCFRRCAAAILITGSISSTSGADEGFADEGFGGCAAPPPADAGAALGGLASAGSGSVPYREEVRHPALPGPETAGGELRMAPDGTLIREQRRPTPEVAEIGDSFLALRRPPNGPRNLMPIPSGMKPMFEALRHAVAGDAEALMDGFSPTLVSDGAPWRVRLAPRAEEAAGEAAGEAGDLGIVLVGCGASLRGMELTREGGSVRRIFLGRP